MIFTDKAAKEKIASLESRIAELEADIVAKDSVIEAHAGEISERDQTIAEHVATIATRDEAIAAITQERDTLTAQVEAHAGEIVQLKADVESAKKSAGLQAVGMLASIGQPEPAEVIAESIDPEAEKKAKLQALPPLARVEAIFAESAKKAR